MRTETGCGSFARALKNSAREVIFTRYGGPISCHPRPCTSIALPLLSSFHFHRAHEEVSAREKFKPKWGIGICLKSYKNGEETWHLCVKQKDQHHIVSDCSPDQIKAHKVGIITINPRRTCSTRITVLGLCDFLSVCLSTTILALQATRRLMSDTNSFSATRV